MEHIPAQTLVFQQIGVCALGEVRVLVDIPLEQFSLNSRLQVFCKSM